MKKKQKFGQVVNCSLKGVRAELIRKGTTGFTVRLLGDVGAYKAGDIVVLGTGEFAADAKEK